MTRPRPDSQEGRILGLLESAEGRKVPLPAILDLRPRISQYSRAVHTLRHKYGFRIENGCEEGRTDQTWFRLAPATQLADRLEDREIQAALRRELETGTGSRLLFEDPAPERHLDLG